MTISEIERKAEAGYKGMTLADYEELTSAWDTEKTKYTAFPDMIRKVEDRIEGIAVELESY